MALTVCRYDPLPDTSLIARTMVWEKETTDAERIFLDKFETVYESPIIQAYYFEEFWSDHFPNICVAKVKIGPTSQV